jgi:hypothetical protein
MLTSFKKRDAEVLNHWIALAERFQFSPSDYYDAIAKEIQAHQVPGLEMIRVEFAEGGMLSNKRVYLRIVRERLVFDVCLAPFGTGSFFSSRAAEIPAVVQPWQLAAILASILLTIYLSMRYIGILLGPIILIICLIGGVYTLRNAVAMGLSDLDAMLIRSPAFGAIYEAWFRKETYYRIDTRLMYLETVTELVKKIAEDITAAKGVKLIRQYECAPVLGELYKPSKARAADHETQPHQ